MQIHLTFCYGLRFICIALLRFFTPIKPARITKPKTDFFINAVCVNLKKVWIAKIALF